MTIYRLSNGTNINLKHVVFISEFKTTEVAGSFETQYVVSFGQVHQNLKLLCRDELEHKIAKEGYWDLIREWERAVGDTYNTIQENGEHAAWNAIREHEPKDKPTVKDKPTFENTVTLDVLSEIGAERERQLKEKNYTRAHDDDHDAGELAHAAATYTILSAERKDRRKDIMELVEESDDKGLKEYKRELRFWPWPINWLRLEERREDLIKAAALIVAEIERLDRVGSSGLPLRESVIKDLELLKRHLGSKHNKEEGNNLRRLKEEVLDELEDYGYMPALKDAGCLNSEFSIDHAIAFLRENKG